ncbi:hypothetical protein [uncultured Thermomonospora sp.]|uniref:hypothetical protein n=1 Tax=uncultured Thermomonospora sp. TaxID=671175 RepID=UPI00259AF037|nr:hypothetical protein [uncultured Thermomonospora sp.]
MATATDTIRYFGKCPIKGCKTRRIVDGGPYMAFRIDGQYHQLNRHEYGFRTRQEHIEWAEFMRGLDLVCTRHNKFLTWQSGRFTYNPEKICSPRCMGATGPACDCSCGGENHGGRHVMVL